MREELLGLIDEIDHIESQFHTFPRMDGFAVPYEEQIGDVPDFQLWIQRAQRILLRIVETTGDQFTQSALDLAQGKFDGWQDKTRFTELKNKLLVMRDDIDSLIPDDQTKGALQMGEIKSPRVFISHATDDKTYVAKLVTLLDGMGLNHTQIFCSSLPGYDIPIGMDIIDYLREQFNEYDLWVFFIHSPQYYTRPVCLNEMGAAWALKNKYISILLPGFGFGEMTGVVNSREIAIKLDNDKKEVQDKLNQLYTKLIADFKLTKMADVLWEEKRNTFIDAILALGPAIRSIGISTDDDDMEMLDSGLYIKKSESIVGKTVFYCPACYIKEHKAYPIVQGAAARNRFCCNCKMSYSRV